MNKFERKFIVNPGGQAEEKKLTDKEKTNLKRPPEKNCWR